MTPASLGKYRITRVLGKGGMGVVYEGIDDDIGRRVALKTLSLAGVSRDELQALRKRLRREAAAIGRLHHTHIVTLYELAEDPASGTTFLAMEFVDGVDLGEYFSQSRKRLPLPRIGRIMTELLTALEFAHAKGVVHRDIKLGNVLIEAESGNVKLADFGIAHLERTTRLSATGMVMGTPHCMAPEQFLGTEVDARTDVYAAGVLLYELLTGTVPFAGDIAQILYKTLNEDPVHPSSINTQLPPGLDVLVLRAMSKDKEDRFPSAQAFSDAIQRSSLRPEGPEALGTADQSTFVRPARQARPSTGSRTPVARSTPAFGRRSGGFTASLRSQQMLPRQTLPQLPGRKRWVLIAALMGAVGGSAFWVIPWSGLQQPWPIQQAALTTPPVTEPDTDAAPVPERTAAPVPAPQAAESVSSPPPAAAPPAAVTTSPPPAAAPGPAGPARVSGAPPASHRLATVSRPEESRPAPPPPRERRERTPEPRQEPPPKVQRVVPAPAPRIVHHVGDVFRDCSDCPEMVMIGPGAYQMGSETYESRRDKDESPQHTVHIAYAFAVGRYPVTRTEWRRYVAAEGNQNFGCNWENPGYPQLEDHPVVCITWRGAREYAGWLSRKTGHHYRLLSEAEYEYVNRAGTHTAYFWGDEYECAHANGADAGDGLAYGAQCNDGYEKTSPVGRFPPNSFGLYDTTGNVWEWTEDCYSPNYTGAPDDGSPREGGSNCAYRVIRGGSWGYSPGFLRSARRFKENTTTISVGLRIARTD